MSMVSIFQVPDAEIFFYSVSQDGILMAVLTIDRETGQPVAGPDIVSRGFVYMRDAEELLERARQRVLDSFVGLNGHASDW